MNMRDYEKKVPGSVDPELLQFIQPRQNSWTDEDMNALYEGVKRHANDSKSWYKIVILIGTKSPKRIAEKVDRLRRKDRQILTSIEEEIVQLLARKKFSEFKLR